MKTPFGRLAGFGWRLVVLAAFLCASAWLKAVEQLFYGLLHSHTYFSDGSGTPEDAYRTAKANGVVQGLSLPQDRQPHECKFPGGGNDH